MKRDKMTAVTSPSESQQTGDTDIGFVPIDQVYSELATVISSIGKKDFYDRLSRFVARAISCDRRLVMRYSAFDRPCFIVNNFMNKEAESLYLAGLFQIDPLQQLARTSRTATIVNLRSSNGNPLNGDEYLSEIFKLAFIFDELAFMLPAPGGITFAVCCEKIAEAFSAEEQAHARAMLPIIESLHELHLDEIFSRPMRQVDADDTAPASDDAYLLLDSAGAQIFASDGWRACTAITDETEAQIRQALQDGKAHLALAENLVVHWEPLGPQFSLAPGGMLLRVEQQLSKDVSMSAENMIDAFCQSQNLTPREQEIVRLILNGFPNSKIAERLDISAGTVKNHRWRLYYKLDITSERELFILFLSGVLSSPVDGPLENPL